jgi:hypothetical protein
MPSLNSAFGAAVRRIMDETQERRLSLRKTSIRTGIDIDTLSRMREGVVPRLDKVVSFAQGFGLDVNAWIDLAGLPRINNPREYFWIRFGALVDLCRQLGIKEPAPPRFHGGSESLTYEEADAAVEQVAEGLIQDYPEHAEALRELLPAAA